MLDYYELDNISLMGISWGGYFTLRATAYDKQIKQVICHGVLYHAFDVQKHLIQQPVRTIFHVLFRLKQKKLINALAKQKMNLDPLAEWGLTHGMYITNTSTPYDFLEAIEQHNLRKELKLINQDVLLLTGEKDHYIPR